ncbi:MAG: ABC transporter substrate-binding protein, partial [Hymenobacteraceae bacterium]|nr:ABC transporter substrate-binding protein [Hymenobacteraceae bacterium]MDX5395654.1 ABC transporter substrate-binding protein [Hymenobacteraceae bacterium]MDX5511708.1 ABC transporter substrate-binding protein [Hymenobacteraceae bacterium]
MPAEIKHKTRKTIALAVVVLVLLLLAGWGIYWYTAKNKSYYTVGIIYNSVNLQPDDLDVIQLLLRKRVAEINDAGGIAGKPIRLRYLDDKGSRETVYKIVQESVQDESLIGYIGCWSSTRVQAAAGVVGKAGVPFIGGYSVTAIAEPYPNMFSYEMEVSRVAFVIHNLVKSKAKKLALIANAQDIYSQALFNEIHRLAKQDMGYSVVLEKWYPNEHSFSPDELNNLTDSLQQSADFVLLSANPKHTNILVSAIGSRHLSIPVFTAFSDIPEIDPKVPGFKAAELYDVSVFGIPSALNLRNQELEARFKKQLKQSPRLQFQLGLGGLHADALGLLKEASELETNGNPLPIRQQISRGLSEYINGKKVFRGWFSDWYFTPDRALVNEVLVGWKPEHQQLPLLAPQQFLRSDTGLQQAPVLYTQIDLQELDQVNEENGTFHASFFLEIQSEDTVNLKQIDFVNAVRNNVNQKPLLEARLLQEQQNATHQNMFYYMYAVTGQFQFQPDLRQYPFDQQRFSIVLQTNSALRP